MLPVLATLLGACVDLSRAYETLVKLESASRDAAEFAAMNATTASEALTQAKTVVCGEFRQPSNCTDPSVSLPVYTRSVSSPGTTANPKVTVSVTASTTFNTVVPWPFLSSGNVALSKTVKYEVLQGR